MLIKFRSFHNAALPTEDKQVVQVDFSEIESINKTRIERRTSSLRGKKQTEFITCLDIHLNSCDVSQLKELISEEKKKRIQKKNGSSITRHYPVNVVEDKIIRIELRGSKPLTGKVVKILSQYVKTDSAIKISEDFTGTSANKAEIETKILQLIEQGNKIAAIGLLRRNNSMSLSEAKKFVDELS